MDSNAVYAVLFLAMCLLQSRQIDECHHLVCLFHCLSYSFPKVGGLDSIGQRYFHTRHFWSQYNNTKPRLHLLPWAAKFSSHGWLLISLYAQATITTRSKGYITLSIRTQTTKRRCQEAARLRTPVHNAKIRLGIANCLYWQTRATGSRHQNQVMKVDEGCKNSESSKSEKIP